MTLSFSQTYPERMGELSGKTNFFPYKIQQGLFSNGLISVDITLDYQAEYQLKSRSNKTIDLPTKVPSGKITTIREDKHNRWKAGNKIHFVINNQTKDRFQFAPVLECTSVQKIEIRYYDKITKHRQYQINGKNVSVIVDGRTLPYFDICVLCLNEGFPSVESFFDWFNKNFEGKIIHWTDLKY